MIEVKNLVKCYGNHAAVDDLTFSVEKGKVVGFLGPNGAGKSTTMNMITGYIAPTSGTVLIDGVDILEEPEKAKEKIGYLPEIPPLYPDLRVREYLDFVVELKRVPKKERAEAVSLVIEKTKIGNVEERLIRHLSKGYKQRVGLAAAMLGQPDILILDEPTVGLDPSQIIEIRELIRELSKEHTVLLSSHIMQEITAVCDEIIIISEGQMIASGTPEELTQQMVPKNGIEMLVKGEHEKIVQAIEEIEYVEKVDAKCSKKEGEVEITVYSQKDVREKIFFALVEVNSPILEMHSMQSTLEDAFLALTEEKPPETQNGEGAVSVEDTGAGNVSEKKETVNESADTVEVINEKSEKNREEM